MPYKELKNLRIFKARVYRLVRGFLSLYVTYAFPLYLVIIKV